MPDNIGQQDAAPAPTATPRRGEHIELDITDLADRGRGVGRINGMVCFVTGGLPGDRVEAIVTRRKRSLLEARVERVVTPSPDRVDKRCRHFGSCGGCSFQDLAYDAQVRFKVSQMTEQLSRIGHLDDIPEPTIVPADPVDRYRNKMEFSFGQSAEGRLMLGLHPRGNFRDVFDLEECHLIADLAQRVVVATREFFLAGDEPAYHPVRHTGFLRFVVVRLGVNSGESLVNLVTSTTEHVGGFQRAGAFGAMLRKALPELTTAVWTVNMTRANIAAGDVVQTFFGPGHFTERLGRFGFRIAPMSFFQTNTRTAEKLFATAVAFATRDDPDRILDLYSGTGAISLFLSEQAREVVGVELHDDSVTAARENAERNSVTNCQFIGGDVLDYLRDQATGESGFDTIVIDPPRAGLHPKALKLLIRQPVKVLVYVSCNPATLARDLESLTRTAYRLTDLAAIDMFPHTPHLEAVVRLERA